MSEHLDWLRRLRSNLKIWIPKEFHLRKFEETLDYAIRSMEKLEQIEQIYKAWESDKYTYYVLEEIGEVLENE